MVDSFVNDLFIISSLIFWCDKISWIDSFANDSFKCERDPYVVINNLFFYSDSIHKTARSPTIHENLWINFITCLFMNDLFIFSDSIFLTWKIFLNWFVRERFIPTYELISLYIYPRTICSLLVIRLFWCDIIFTIDSFMNVYPRTICSLLVFRLFSCRKIFIGVSFANDSFCKYYMMKI